METKSPLRLTLRQLQVFAAVAHGGSTGAAGARIALSQSAASAAINELERVLGVRLFDRAGRRLVLNDHGRAMLPRAQALLDGADGIERLALDAAAQLALLRIGASTTIANYVLPGMLARLYAGAGIGAAGSWHSLIAVANTAAICRKVADFELDVGFIEGAVHEARLDPIPWLQDEMVVVGRARGRALQGKTPLSVLREAVWLLREPGSGTREAADHALLPHLHAYRRSIEVGSSEAIKHAAADGLGLACLSRWVVQDLLEAGRLSELKTSLPRIMRPCYVVLNRARARTPALRLLLTAAGRVPGAGASMGRAGAGRTRGAP